MKPARPAKFAVAHAEVDKARARLAKRVTTMFLPVDRLSERLPKPTQRCLGCGYWVQGPCSTCQQDEED